MPIKYLTPSKLVYSFGGGANDVQVLDPADTTSYSVDLGGGDDTAVMSLGNDTVYGGSGSDSIEGGQGNDTLYGDSIGDVSSRRPEVDTIYGDSSGTISTASYVAGSDVIFGASGSANFTNLLYGDALFLDGNATGSSDQITGGNLAQNTIYGDAYKILGSAIAGNDVLAGGNGGGNTIYGDAEVIQSSTGSLQGGNDVITGGSGASNTLFGDAQNFIAGAGTIITGGNDILTAGDGGTNTLYGDSRYVTGAAVGGSDTLVSGTGNDIMWGDSATLFSGATLTGGHDTFVFKPNSGNDTIMDFSAHGASDLIDVSAYGITSLSGLTYEVQNGNTIIHLDATDLITLVGYTDELTHTTSLLSSTDFIFHA